MAAPASTTATSYPHYLYLRRNLILLTLDYALFGIGSGLIQASTFVPDYFSKLTTDERLIGLAGSVALLAWLLPQLLFAQFISRRHKRQIFLVQTVFSRFLIMIIAFVTISARPDQTGLLIGVFFALYPLFYTLDGLASLVWTDRLGTTMTPRARAVMFSVGQLIVAFGALGGRELLRFLLGPTGLPFPGNYGSVFLVASLFFVAAGFCLAFSRAEPNANAVVLGPTLGQYLPYLWRILRTDSKFFTFILTRVLFDLSGLALPFFIVFGVNILKLDSRNLVGDTLLVTQVGAMFASAMIGWISARYGPRLIIQLTGVARLAMPLLALLSIEAGAPALYGAFFCFGIINSTIAPGYFDWIINHAPESERAIYMGLTNTISAVGNLAPFMGGLLLNQTGSYSALFITAAVLAVAGLILSARLIEPRNRTAVPILPK